MQMAKPFAEPGAIRTCQRRHVGNGANTEEISGGADRIRLTQRFGKGSREHVGEAHPRKPPIGRVLRSGGGVN